MQRGADIESLEGLMARTRRQYETWMAKATEIDLVMMSAAPDESKLERSLDEGLVMADAIAQDLKTFEQRLDAVVGR